MVSDTKKYLCRYFFCGSWWTVTIDASSHEEAEKRVDRMATMQVLGELGGSIPASTPGASFIIRVVIGVKNFFLPNVGDEVSRTAGGRGGSKEIL